MLILKTHAALAAALLFAGAAGAATSNGLANGGFEMTGAPGFVANGWQTAIATGNPAQLSNDAHTGVHSVGPLLECRSNTVYIDDIQLSLTVAAAAEPETYALLIADLGVVGAIARRRRA